MTLALGASMLSGVASAPPSAPASPPPMHATAGPAGGVAFTDDRDGLARYTPDGYSFGDTGRPGLTGALPVAAHEGESSVGGAAGAAFTAFVSNASGTSDVYAVAPGGTTPMRISCGAPASHPVITPFALSHDITIASGAVTATQVRIAWASAVTGAGNDGHWNIWSATIDVWDPAHGTEPTGPCGSGPVAYRVGTPQPLAGQTGDNLWPAWVGPQDAAPPGNPVPITVTDLLVYESTRDNPLGDIYEQAASGAAATRRTDGSAGNLANTQPAVYNPGSTAALVFTTTKYRSDGSLASAILPTPIDPTVPTFGSAWDEDVQQSSEATVVNTCYRTVCGVWVGYRTTALSPYGGVAVTHAYFDPPADLVLDPALTWRVSADPATGESHPALQSDDGHTLTGVLVTRRAIRAKLSAAQLSDGSGRAGLVAATPDEGTVAYSPDGKRIAYSQLAVNADNSPASRRIVVANADGSAPVVQDFGQATDAAAGDADFDSQPVWSPDGTRIAFIRERYHPPSPEFGHLVAPPRLFVGTVGANTATGPALSGGTAYYDSHPSWAPSGNRLVLSRAPAPADLGVSLTAQQGGVHLTEVITASASNLAFGPAVDAHLIITLPPVLTVPAAVPGCTVTASAGDPTVVDCPLGTVSALGSGGPPITFTVTSANACRSTVIGEVRTSSRDADPLDDRRSVTFSFDSAPGSCTGDLTDPGVTGVPLQPATLSSFVTGIRGILAPPSPTEDPQLWTVDATTGAGAPLTTAALGETVLGADPAWSPDGRSIAYTVRDQIGLATLTTTGGAAAVPETAAAQSAVTGYAAYDTNVGGTPTPSRATLSAATDPTWVRDGSELVFAGQPAGRPDDGGIYAVKPDGSGLRTIAQQPQPETEPGVLPINDADVSVAVVVSQPVAYVGGPMTATVTVRNGGPLRAAVTLQTGFPVSLQATGVPVCVSGSSPCALGLVDAGGVVVFVVGLLPQPVGTPAAGYVATITAVVSASPPDPVPGNNTATLTLPVRQPRIRLLPEVLAPGFVTLAFGEDFPPGAPVSLVWLPGISVDPGPSVVAGDGTLRVQVPVVDRDLLGQRVIVASSVAGQFGAVQGPMLVVPRTDAPPDFVGRR